MSPTRTRVALLGAVHSAALVAPARAQPDRLAKPASESGADDLTSEEVAEIGFTGWVLKRLEATADLHAQKTTKTAAARAHAVLGAWAHVAESRAHLVRRLERALRDGFRHPDARPQAMLTLADLYLDQWATVDRYHLEREDAGEKVAAEHPADLAKRYTMGRGPALRVWEAFVARHPDHPRAPEVLDDISQVRADLGDYATAKRALRQLLCANRARELAAAEAVQQRADDQLQARVYAKTVSIEDYSGCTSRLRDPVLRADAWIRLGRLHRSGTNETHLAISAFEQVLEDPESPYYVTALQEIADAYYDGGQLLEAIPMLDDLIARLDEMRDLDSGLEEMRRASIVRIGRIVAQLWRASAVANPDGALKLADIYYRGREHQPHVREIYVELGVALHGFGAFDQAIPVWRHVLEKWPLHVDAPLVEEALVDLLVEKGDSRAADAERRRLLDVLSESSAWYRANAASRRAMEMARRLAEDTMFALARNQYRRVAVAADPEVGSKAQAKQGLATLRGDTIALYERFLSAFPESKHAYEARFQLAETMLFDQRFAEAARRFGEVRERRGSSGRYFEQATRKLVEAREAELAHEIETGVLHEPALPKKNELSGAGSAAPLPVAYAELQQAYEQYAEVVISPAQAAELLLTAAQIDLRFRRVAKAEARLRRLVEEHCQTGAAKAARARLAQIFEARGEGGADSASARWLGQACSGAMGGKVAREAKVNELYAQAESMAAAGRHEDAGRRFYAAYRLTTDKHRLHDDSLFQAALELRAAGKLSAALSLLRAFVEDRPLHKSELYAEALWLIGQAYARTFDYERAVTAYLRLVSLAGTRGYRARAGFDLADSANEALWHAAELRELDRVYYDRGADDPGAATLFKMYAATQKRARDRASEAYLRAAAVYKKAGDAGRVRKTFAEWRKRYARFAGAGRYEVRFQHMVASALLVSGDRQGAAKAFASAVRAFDRAHLKPGTADAELAAEAQFWLAEEDNRKSFEPYAFAWPKTMATDPATAKEAIRALIEASVRARAELAKVHRFESTWSIAAHERAGDAWLAVANKVIDAPLPDALAESQKQKGDVDALAAVVEEIRGALQPVYDAAAVDWNRAVMLARERGLVNRWSNLAQRQLNRYVKPGTYPVHGDEIVVREVLP